MCVAGTYDESRCKLDIRGKKNRIKLEEVRNIEAKV